MSTTNSTETNTNDTSATASTPAKINPEQATAFAALILADDNLAITSEKLQTLLKAAGIAEIQPIWTTLFANALKGKDVKDILTAVATSGPKAGGDVAPPICRSDDLDNCGSRADVVDIDSGSDSEDFGGPFGLFD